MGYSSGEDTDISDSEVGEYEEEEYKKLKSGSRSVKVSDEGYNCPYCTKKRKREFSHHELLQHASGVGNCNSNKRTPRDKANHLALVKFLQNDAAASGESNDKAEPEPAANPLADCDRDEMFVWPWIGIVVNLPTQLKEGRYVGESGSKLRDQYIRRGFNPNRVRPLWNYQGHSGTALVEFQKDWSGFSNAMAFEKAYDADRHGKKEWKANNEKKYDLFAWVARADDYNANNIIGENLRKIGDLRTISDIMEEEARKAHKLVSNLTSVIEEKNLHLKEMESKFEETTQSLSILIEEKEKLLQSYNEEIKKIQSNARDHLQRILGEHEKLKSLLEKQKRDLEIRGQELEKREAQNESDQKKLLEEREQNALLNSSLSAAAEEQRKADEKVMKLAEEQKRQKEELHKRIHMLEKQLDAKQKVELEIVQLQGQLNVVKHMGVGDESDQQEILVKVDELLKGLREKEAELEDLESLNQTLIVKERLSNDELVDARKELVNGLKELTRTGPIGVKRMGELDSRPFLEAMKRKYGEMDSEDRATELCSLWEEHLRDPNWHPLKVRVIDGKETCVVDEEDEKLNELKKNYGEDVYKAVANAKFEINEYNASGSYIVSELWNYGDGRKANLKEGVDVLLTLWKKKKAAESG